MLPPTLLATRPAWRRAILWLLACLIGIQGLSVAVSAARGPAHAHREAAVSPVLEDVRRSVGALPGSRAGSGSLPGHHHAVALRHHHQAADTSLMLIDSDRITDAAAEEGGAALDIAVAAFVAILMLLWMWMPPGLSHRRQSPATWQPSFATARLLDRPPQPA